MAIQCKRCGSGVPDMADKCGVCNAPVDEEPQAPVAAGGPSLVAGIPGLATPSPQPVVPNYINPGPGAVGAPSAAPMAGGSGGEIRVSLTGEVYEVPPPTARGTGPGGYASAPSGRPGPGAPPLPVRGPAGAPTQAGGARPRYGLPAAAAEQKSGGVPIWTVLLVLLVLGGGGAGAFYWLNHRSDPKVEALAIYKSVIALDFKSLYPRVAFTPADKAKYPNADSFDRETKALMDKDPNSQLAKKILGMMTNVQVGEPVVTGNSADVPTSMDLSVGGRTIPFKGTAHLVREWGMWKLDAKSGGYADGFKVGQDLVGKPDMAALGAAGGELQNMLGGGIAAPGGQ